MTDNAKEDRANPSPRKTRRKKSGTEKNVKKKTQAIYCSEIA